MKSKKRDAQKTQDKLLATAERIFVERGFDGARVDEIADQAGVNKRMIYLRFGSKEALYLEVLRSSFKRLFASPRPEPDPGGDPVKDCEALVRWYFWFLSDNPSFVRLLGWETLNDGRLAGKVLTDLMEEGLDPLKDIITRGKTMGSVRKDVATHKLVTILHELCIGYFSRLKLLEVVWRQNLKTRDKQQEMLDQIVKVVLDGIKTKDRT